MADRNVKEQLSACALHSMVVQHDTEQCVRVNQRMLIDKMFARYSSDFVVFRELIQNADDATATSFSLEIGCEGRNFARRQWTSVTDVQHLPNEKQNEYEHHSTSLWKKLKHRLRNNKIDALDASPNNLHSTESSFQNRMISEIRALNNGRHLSKNDWQRIAAIADGNIDVDSIGQFGVGFFSVFAYSDSSGKECMVFVWRDERTLTTYRQELPVERRSPLTTIILPMRRQYLIQTHTNLDDENRMKSSGSEKNKEHKESKSLHKIVPKIDLEELKIFLSKGNN